MINDNVFAENAQEYDAWFDDHELEYNLELDAIRSLLPESGLGIEIGVGSGRFAESLGIAVGVEPARSMAAIAAARGIHVISSKAELLPIESSSYDYALMITTDCFLESPEKAYQEIFRILKENGKILIGFIDKDGVLGKKYSAKKNTSKFYRHANFHSTAELVTLLKLAGFGNFEFYQALLPADVKAHQQPVVKRGFGEGSFVVMRATKNQVLSK